VKIDLANNGLEAIEMVQQKNYDVIFMDLKMPVLDGISATKEIRSLKNLTQQPWIIAITATVLPEVKDVSLKSGMNDYITKPIQLNNLQNVLAKYEIERERNGAES
jgi:CheY-like chemotaxis protein